MYVFRSALLILFEIRKRVHAQLACEDGDTMIRMKSLLGTLVAAAGIAAIGSVARADDSYQVFNFDDSVSSLYNVTFQLFNNNLGILNGVTYEFDATNTANFYGINANNFSVVGVPLASTVNVTVVGPPSATTYLSDNVTASDTINIPSGLFYDNGVVGTLSDTAIVATGDLSAYKGAGTGSFAINIAPEVFGGTLPGGVYGGTFSHVTTGSVTLHYNYTRVITPEPGTWALLAASSVMGVAGIRRRRRRA
jgi:hypothetical protein